MKRIAIIGAGVSGLTSGVLLDEHGATVTILADKAGAQTTSAAAGAIWYPYDAEPFEKVIAWSLATFDKLVRLTNDRAAGVRIIELRCLARGGQIEIPGWAEQLGACRLTNLSANFSSGFAINVPLIDTSIYLPYLTQRFARAGGTIDDSVHFVRLDDVRREHEFVVNCAGVGARELVDDKDVEPHRGQIVLAENLPLDHAIVCDDPPLTYIFPRTNDCVCGGTNALSWNRAPNPDETASIIIECARILGRRVPKIVAERVGLRPFRKSGVRLERDSLGDGRVVVHNYGHGGSGFTLSWGCAEEVARLVAD